MVNMKKSVKKCVNVLGMLGTVWFASTLLFGCESNNVTPVEENGQTVVKMKFSEIGEYKLDLYATDEAGNETRDVFTLEVAEKTLLAKVTGFNKILTIGISVGIILLIILIILAINIISKKNQILSDIEEKEDK